MKVDFNGTRLRIEYVTDKAQYAKALQELQQSNLSIYGLDIETLKAKFPEHKRSGLCPLLSYPRLIQIATTNTVYVFDTLKLGWYPAKLAKAMPPAFTAWLKSKKFVAHNGVFELTHFTYQGVRNLDVECSMVMSRSVYCAEHSQYEKTEEDEDMLPEDGDGLSRYRNKGHGLDDCIQRELGVRVEKAMQTSNWNAPELSNQQIAYAALDAHLTRQLYFIYLERIQQHNLTKSYNVLKAMQHVIADMHIVGLGVDWDKHAVLVQKWTADFEKANVAAAKYFKDVNLASSKQMGRWLEANMPQNILDKWEKTPKGAYCFTRTKLTNFMHLPQIKALAEWKKNQKLLSTYGESLREHASPVDGRLRTSYSLGQTATARLSSSSPNLQNIPSGNDFREVFIPAKGNVLVVADFSQIEVRVQAELSKDAVMRGAYAKKQDIYKVFASSLYHKEIDRIDKKERSIAKTSILGLAYGMGATKLCTYALNAGVDITQEEADRARNGYHRTFSTYSHWCDEQRQKAEVLGYANTLLGKKRKLLPDEVYTRAPNHAVQGTAAELLFVSSILCRNLLDKHKVSAKLCASVHDEALIECREEDAEQAKQILEESMCRAMQKLFPNASSFDVAEATVGSNWAQAKG